MKGAALSECGPLFFHQQLANGIELVVDGGFNAMTI
jgi:hypothetical protein